MKLLAVALITNLVLFTQLANAKTLKLQVMLPIPHSVTSTQITSFRVLILIYLMHCAKNECRVYYRHPRL